MPRFLIILFLTVISMTSTGQTLERADELNAGEKFDEAVAEYRAVLASDPSNGQAWYGLGRALQSLQRYDEALEAFDRAGEIGFRSGGVLFRKGTIHLEMGDLETAREWLSKAFESGVPVYTISRNFPSFERVKDDASFQAFLATLAPCSSPEHRQFDFWIGDWDVYNPSGQKVGENTIETILGGCIIYEDWTGGMGGAGRSFNRYDPDSSTWNQHWVNSSGVEMLLRGTYENGRMVMETGEGVNPKMRWTWYEIAPGKVRQMAAQTTDGKSWTTVWDSIYIPKGTEFELE